MECNRVSKKECKVARQRALKLLNFVQQEISKKYKFSYRFFLFLIYMFCIYLKI